MTNSSGHSSQPTGHRADEPAPSGGASTAGAAEADGLYIQLFSVHGLIRSHDLELGRDADTGGQTKYVVELARALGRHPRVARVDLFTRLIDDPALDDGYGAEREPLGDRAQLVRIRAGGRRYRRKEVLWPVLDEFVEGVLRFNREEGVTPDLVHGHYADAGYVAMELASYLGVPLVFTGHSLGRNKLAVLARSGLSADAIQRQYHIERRIEVEEALLSRADLVVASTRHEVERGYELYDAHRDASYRVIPPGIEVDTFYPYYYDLDPSFETPEEVVRARVRMEREIGRFLNTPDKPLILAISRPDRRKNIEGLVHAYGQDAQLQSIANLAVFAGVRRNILEMDDNERDVLTGLLLLMDRYDLYGKLALPKKHEPDTDIPVLYRLAAGKRGVFINPALVENFGITLLEASSSGLPVVSTDHGGPQDIIGLCESGLLIDARDTDAIQESLKHVLTDSEAWERYSQNGVRGVREHFSWSAHAQSYLEAVDEVISQGTPRLTEPAWRGTIGRHLAEVDRLLISDIDYTLVAEDERGDPEALTELRRALEGGGIGFGVATGRSLELVVEVLENHDLPQPDIVVCAVGSEIYYGADFLPDHGYQSHLAYRWKPQAIREALADLPFLELQEEENQRRFKISYYMPDSEGLLQRVREVLNDAGLRSNLIYSHGQFLDVLPHRASKGKAIRYLSHKWGIPAHKIAVAGDSGNDTEMLRGQFNGIVVGNHAEELTGLVGEDRVYFAEGHYARGVLEGLRHYRFLT